MNISGKTLIMLRKKVTLVTAFSLLYLNIFFVAFAESDVPPIPEETAKTPNFIDVEPGEEHYVAIQYLKDQGLIEGYEDGTYKPYQEINRAEALKILMNAISVEIIKDTETEDPIVIPEENKLPATKETIKPDPTDDSDTPDNENNSEDPENFYFPDISPTDWYYTGIKKAWDNKLVQGYPDGYFHPEQTINRAESLKISLIQEGAEIPETVTEPPYADVPIDSWFAPYAKVSFDRTLFIESRGDGNLYPSQNMNRGEFAELIYRLIKSADGSVFTRSTWYGFEGANWGTASGEKFEAMALTAAHKTLPFGTVLKVTNSNNGKTVEVKVNDRGPYVTGVHLDLSRGAFEEIASLGAGIIFTEFEVIESPIDETEETPENIPEESTNIVEYGF